MAKVAIGTNTPDSLEKIELLSELSPAARAEVERACQWRRFAAHEQILDRNSDSRDVYFVVEGTVEVIEERPAAQRSLAAGRYIVSAQIGDGTGRVSWPVSVEPGSLCKIVVDPPAMCRAGDGEGGGANQIAKTRAGDAEPAGAANETSRELVPGPLNGAEHLNTESQHEHVKKGGIAEQTKRK